MIEVPDFRVEIGHIMGCLGMDENTLREELKVYLQKSYLDGVMKEKEEQDGREQRDCKRCA